MLEFQAFARRLARSHARAVGEAEVAVGRLRGAVASASVGAAASPAQLMALSAAAALSGAGGDTAAGAGMRFNEDLSLRPAWLPPCGAGPRLALLQWWDLQGGGRGQPAGAGVAPQGGGGVPWWHSTRASESAAAQPLREAQVPQRPIPASAEGSCGRAGIWQHSPPCACRAPVPARPHPTCPHRPVEAE